MHASRFGVHSLLRGNNSFQKNGDFVLCSNSFASHQPQRTFAAYRTKRRSLKVPLAIPSMETLTTGRGVWFTPPKKEDKSAIVGFVSPPRGYRERTDQAHKYGVQNFYFNDMRDSVYTLHVDDSHPPTQTLEEYISEKMDKFKNKFPDSIIYPVKLSPSITAHFDSKGLQHNTAVFNQGSLTLMATGQTSHSLPYMSFFLKTPGGFWRLNWYSQLENLLERNLGFCRAVKDLKVILREDPNKVAMETKAKNSSKLET